MTLIDELFDNWCKCDVDSCWNEFLVCNIYMMTMDIEILVGLWICVVENIICEYSLLNEMLIWDEWIFLLPLFDSDGCE